MVLASNLSFLIGQCFGVENVKDRVFVLQEEIFF